MKTSFIATLLFSIAINIHGQISLSPTTVGQSGVSSVQDTPYAVVNRNANSRTWERTTYEQGPDGKTFPHVHRYEELATGLNYKDTATGEWLESKEEINVLPTGGAAATQGQHHVYFPSDIYNGEIRMVTPEGKVLRSRPLGLSYDDGTNTVLISELKDSVGELIGSNQVIYPDAFTDFKADLLYTYTKSGFEQDIILREAPRTPESYGLNGATARLQVLTEFFSPPQPAIIPSALPLQAGLALTDQTLDFGDTEMIRGRAFLLGVNATDKPVRVGKQWLLLDGRQFLVEEVPVNAIVNGLAALPQTAMNSSATKTPQIASQHLALPPQRLAKRDSSKVMMLAKNQLPAGGFVLDYQTVNGVLANFTFQGDTTYYINGRLVLSGTNTVEGGAVIKFTNSSSGYLQVSGGGVLISKTGPYRMAVFTSMNDNSVGETITGSSGSPVTTSAQYLVLFYDAATSSNTSLSYLRFAYAGTAVEQLSEGTAYINISPIWNCQFVNCGTAIGVGDYDNLNVLNQRLYNVLFARCVTAVTNEAIYYSGKIALSGENVTADSVNSLLTTWSGDSYATTYSSLTNCILTAVGHQIYFENNGASSSISISTCFVSGSSSGAYQTAGAGSYYLANGTSCHNGGTTNIDTSLLAVLRQKTTYPPIVYSNTTISANLILGPQALRDTAALPDLGYHYDPLDYCFGGVVENSSISFTPGTAVGWFELPGSGGPGFGIRLAGTGSVAFNGTVNAPCTFARYSVVQEGGNGLWRDKGWLAGVTSAQPNSGAVNATAQFTRFAELAADPNDFAEFYKPLYLSANHCEFWSGNCLAYWMHQCFTNCLFDRVNIGIHGNYTSLFAMRNCTIHGGQLYAQHSGGTWPVWIENSAFDGSTYFMDDYSGGDTNITYCDFNAFLDGTDHNEIEGGMVLLSNVSGSPVSFDVFDFNGNEIDGFAQYAGSTFAPGHGVEFVLDTVNGDPISYPLSIAVYDDTGTMIAWVQDLDDSRTFWNVSWDGTEFSIAQSTKHNVSVPSFIWQPGPLGNYYLPNDPPARDGTLLIDGGSITADVAGLFHFTTQTNQTMEANSTVDIGYHYVSLGSDGNPPTTGVQGVPDYQLDSVLPQVSITAPANNSSFGTMRVNVTGTFTDAYLKQITVNGVTAFTSGNTFEARNVPLAAGANTVTAAIEDLVRKAARTSITVNGSATPVDPVQLTATPVAGFSPLSVTFQVTSSAPGIFQDVIYDFEGNGASDLTANDLNPISHTYSTTGEYFPAATVVTSAGRFSSSGGWRSSDPNPLSVNVQSPPVVQSTISVTDPVDLKTTASGNLYVLAGSTATIFEYDSGGTLLRSLAGIGTSPSGLDVDADGNVYVAVTGDNQVLKLNPTTSSFQLDTTFGTSGRIGNDDKTSGSGNGQFNSPFDVAVSPDGARIAVSDSGNNRIQQFTTLGAYVIAFGQLGSASGQFNAPKGLTYDSTGYLYIIDSGNNRIVLAFSSGVVATSGTSGTALGQFQGADNLGVGSRGIYVADTGNNRVQQFVPLSSGDNSSLTPLIGRGLFSNELSLNQPAAVATAEDLIQEKIYIADTGNNRVILVKLPSEDPTPPWVSMKNYIAAGNVAAAASNFSLVSKDDFLKAFLGNALAVSSVSEIGTLTPVYIKNDTAKYYFTDTIDGQVITFSVEFIKENGVWKILEL